VAYLTTRLTLDREAGLLAALVCALSPWAFLASRVFFARYPDRAARAFDREQVAFVAAYLLEHPNEPAAIERLSYPRLATVYHALRLGTLECPKR
jgi:hypothetical protein